MYITKRLARKLFVHLGSEPMVLELLSMGSRCARFRIAAKKMQGQQGKADNELGLVSLSNSLSAPLHLKIGQYCTS